VKIEKYKDAKGEYRWRLKAANGRIVACSGEGYKTKGSLTKGIRCVFSIRIVRQVWVK